MNTLNFLKETIEDIRPEFTLGSNNPRITFIDLKIHEYEKLRHEVFKKYGKLLRINHLFECVGLVDLARKIEVLPKHDVYSNE